MLAVCPPSRVTCCCVYLNPRCVCQPCPMLRHAGCHLLLLLAPHVFLGGNSPFAWRTPAWAEAGGRPPSSSPSIGGFLRPHSGRTSPGSKFLGGDYFLSILCAYPPAAVWKRILLLGCLLDYVLFLGFWRAYSVDPVFSPPCSDGAFGSHCCLQVLPGLLHLFSPPT